MLKGYAVIFGPPDTIYEYGAYLFEFNFPKTYPFSPPKLTYLTNNGKTRFNPNLYRSGKVCVSILNTWRGPGWTSCMTIRTILITLTTLLHNKPLLNEPGITDTHRSFHDYNKIIQYRNFDTLTSAIELCSLKRPDISFEVINLGHVEEKIKSRISKFPYIRIEPLRPRIDALHYAADCDLLLLIQNEDDRSQVTIPYKTYDYLNLGLNVLGLTNNDELDNILTDAGHMSCPISDVDAIAENLLKFINNYKYSSFKSFTSPFDPEKAVLELIAL